VNPASTPQQPYFLRALYEWCVDNGHTPYVTVKVDERTRVPVGYVKDGQIVLNLGPAAVRNLQMDNAWMSFSARFGGVAQMIEVPVENVLAIFARETGEGMAFAQPHAQPASPAQEVAPADAPDDGQDGPGGPGTDRPMGRPSLRVVK
jgi:stringent starvation protein B